MRISSVIALVLVAAITSSTGSAQPREERGGRVPWPGERVRPHRPPPPPHRAGDWVNLATPTPTHHGTEWISIGRNAGAFSTLRIDVVSGTVNVRTIRVDFSNGEIARFYVGKHLDRRHPSAFISLSQPRWIDRIAITTSRWPTGMYTVSGSWAPVPNQDTVASR